MSHRDLVFYRPGGDNENHKVKPDPRDLRADVLDMRRLYYDEHQTLKAICKAYVPLGWPPRRILDVLYYRVYRSLLPIDLDLAPHSSWNAIRRASMLPPEEAGEWHGD